MDNYIIIKSDKLDKLDKSVNEYIKQGYTPLGGVSARSIIQPLWNMSYSEPEYLQAMILYPKKS